jgi:hypothetical protein
LALWLFAAAFLRDEHRESALHKSLSTTLAEVTATD